MGLQCVGTLAVLLLAKNDGLLKVIRPSIDLMISNNIWFGKNLVESALRQAGELA
jgi:predicted nucleic acid-binding protein